MTQHRPSPAGGKHVVNDMPILGLTLYFAHMYVRKYLKIISYSQSNTIIHVCVVGLGVPFRTDEILHLFPPPHTSKRSDIPYAQRMCRRESRPQKSPILGNGSHILRRQLLGTINLYAGGLMASRCHV